MQIKLNVVGPKTGNFRHAHSHLTTDRLSVFRATNHSANERERRWTRISKGPDVRRQETVAAAIQLFVSKGMTQRRSTTSWR